jgi:hypothetical protein
MFGGTMLEQDIYYANILLKKFENLERVCGGAKIHAVKTEAATLSLSVNLAERGAGNRADLSAYIERAEKFLAAQV